MTRAEWKDNVSPEAEALAVKLERGLQVGWLSQDDARRLLVALFGDPPAGGGWYEFRYVKCGRANCRCREDEKERHGPYVYQCWDDEEGKRHQKYLGPPSRAIARLPEDVAAPIRERLEVLRLEELKRRGFPVEALHD